MPVIPGGMDPSELVGDGLRIHLAQVAAEDAAEWESALTLGKPSLDSIADRGNDEDWWPELDAPR